MCVESLIDASSQVNPTFASERKGEIMVGAAEFFAKNKEALPPNERPVEQEIRNLSPFNGIVSPGAVTAKEHRSDDYCFTADNARTSSVNDVFSVL